MSVAQIIERLRTLAAKSPVASKAPSISVEPKQAPIQAEPAPLPSRQSVSAPEVKRRSLSREQAVQKLLALVRAGVDALISGDKSRLEAVVKEIITMYNTLKMMNGKDFADSVFSEAYVKLDGTGKQVLSSIVEGGLNAVLKKRESIVAEYVSNALKKAGVPVSPKAVKEVVAKSKLDIRKLADEVKENMKKLVEAAMKSRAMSGDARKAVEGMRAALAVALGVGGAEAVKMFQRSFQGSMRDAFKFFAKSAFKPIKNEELISRLMATVKKGAAKSGSVEEVARVKSQIVMGEQSSEESNESAGSEASHDVERMGKVMEAMKRSRG